MQSASRTPCGGRRPVVHHHGYAQFPEDREQTLRTLAGNAANPNVAAALFVGLGGEQETALGAGRRVRARVAPPHALILEEAPSVAAFVEEAAAWLRRQLAEAEPSPGARQGVGADRRP